jgi:hypothetical protein
MNKSKQTNKNSQNGKRVNSKQSTMSGRDSEHPRMLPSYEVFQVRTLRFTVTADTTGTLISYANLLDAMLIATSAIAGYDLFDIVKVQKVQVWGLANLGTPSTVGVTFVTTTGDRSLHTDTSLGFKPAYVSATPSRESLASFYQVSGGGSAFLVQAPAGSVVDVTLHVKTSAVAPTPTAQPLIGATIGELYFRGLDGLPVAVTNFPPIPGVLTI